MPQKILLKRGNKANLPKLDAGEPAITLDTEQIFIGGTSGNVEIPTKKEIDSMGINAKYPPAGFVGLVGDGVTDDTTALQNLIDNFDLVILPPGEYLVTDTIRLRNRGKALIGTNPGTTNHGDTCTIKYGGAIDRHKAVVLLGQNEVDSEPTIDTSNIIIENIRIDANNRAGFCLYGTYLTNETIVNNVTLENSLEYNAYFARGWYATFTNITSRQCMGNGLALVCFWCI